ncbi:MAG: ribonuclease PH [Planctomycetota bacterium]|nr:ribonuclease PH [Planctomycetota bacterium]MCX8040238.1 ribonuclease PH [Planctomycetota bacterium]MDW8372467.1 ribonuclease PH [Planctomycetota bacterium]
MRPIRFARRWLTKPAGSCLVSFGGTRVLCSASIEPEVPPHRRGLGGWVTAEYAMLPGSTSPRKKRDSGKVDGRSVEIQRLIGRALRAAVALDRLEEVSIVIDCDVLDADGGTRTAAITGGWLALHDALAALARERGHEAGAAHYLSGQVAAVSVGLVQGQVVVDLDYAADSVAEVDMNLVMRCPLGGGAADFVEIQGTGEHGVLPCTRLPELLAAGAAALADIFAAQRAALAEPQ